MAIDPIRLVQPPLTGSIGEWESGAFELKEGDEDIHTANERRLTELIGPVRLPAAGILAGCDAQAAPTKIR